MSDMTRQGLTVVAVEDDVALLDVVTEALSDEGYYVVPLRDWREAHSTVRREHPGLVLLDLHSNGQETGWRVLDALSLDPETRGTPVVLMTGTLMSGGTHRPATGRKGGVSVLLKPFDLDALCTTVAQSVLHEPVDTEGVAP